MRACVIEVEGILYELVNPQIVRAHGDDRDLEGCLSIPGYVAYVTRHEKVWVVAQNRFGKKVKVAGLGPPRAGPPARAGPPRRQAVHRLPRLDGRADRRRSRRRGRRRGPRGDERPGVSARPGPPDDGRVRAVFLGSGAFAVPSLRAPRRQPARPRSSPSSPRSRSAPVATRHGSSPRSTHSHAQANIHPILTPPRLRHPDAIAAILALRPKLAVLADYGQIVPPPLLDLPLGALNLHPSPLPRFRGAAPVPATILAGDDTTAVTLMRMDAGLDTGPIVARALVDLSGDETAPELESRLAETAASLLDRSLAGWIDGSLTAVPQPEEGVVLTRPLRREDGRLDPSRPAAELERAVRAYQPWPGTFVELPEGRLVVTAAPRGGSGARATSSARSSSRAESPPSRRRRPPRARAGDAAGPSVHAWRGLAPRPAVARTRVRIAAMSEPQPLPGQAPFGLRPAPSATAPRDPRPGISGLTPEALAAWFVEHGQPSYRARQVLDAAWRGRGAGFDEILTLPADLRAELDGRLPVRHRRRRRGPRRRRRPHREGAPPAVGRAADRVRPDALPGPRGEPRAPHAVHQLAGGLRGGLPVLRDRRARDGARPRDRGDRRPGPPCPAPARRRTGGASPTSCSWAWASRCSTSTGCSRRSRRSTTGGGSGSGRAISRSARRASCPGSGA